MQPDESTQALLAEMEQAPALHTLPLMEARDALEAITLDLGPPTNDVDRVDRLLEGKNGAVKVRVYTPRNAAGPISLYIHGGGWALGGIETHDSVVAYLAERSGSIFVSVEYRLSPEHPFPAGLQDCIDALAWCETTRQPSQALVVVGESAGGNLAAALALSDHQRGAKAIDFQILLYPCVDMDPDADFPSRNKFGGGEYFLSQSDLVWLAGMYCTDTAAYADPLASPLRAASFEGLPPALIVTAGFDPLHDEGVAYHDALVAAGVQSIHRDFAGTIHGFSNFAGLLPAGKEALELVASQVKSIPNRSSG